MSRTVEAEEVRRTLARKWDARIIRAEWAWSYVTHLAFKIRGVRAEMSACSETRNAPAWSEVQLARPAPHSLRVAPEEFTTWVRRLFGGKDLEIGDDSFDRTFWVESSNEEWARSILDGNTRERIQGLRDVGPGKNRVCIDVCPWWIRVRVFREFSRDMHALNTVIETGVHFLLKLKGPDPVEFGPVEPPAAGVCPVCSSNGARFRCPGCQTPHHVECWKYSGGCGLFACAGRPRRRRR